MYYFRNIHETIQRRYINFICKLINNNNNTNNNNDNDNDNNNNNNDTEIGNNKN